MSTQNKQAELVREISGVNPLKCMKCGKCSATCPAFGEMDIKPHQFVSYVANGNIEALAESKSLYKCLSCFACIEYIIGTTGFVVLISGFFILYHLLYIRFDKIDLLFR